MSKNYILYNALAANNNCKKNLECLYELLPTGENKEIDVTSIKNFEDFFNGLEQEDNVILAGGDGTLNHFINDIQGLTINNSLFYYPAGTGNDFYNDVRDMHDNKLIPLEDYINELPSVTIDGKTSLFINGIGYGIDGYCCEEGDRLKALSSKPVNYTMIAIKGLLFKYKPTNAVVTVDGVTKSYKKVWLAPTMNGRFYGGGMMATPDQNRLSDKKEVSCMVYFGKGKLKTLMIFPSIFKGLHVEHTEMVHVLKGHDIKVEFDRPTPLQIDGETVLGVSSYEVHTK